MIIFGWGFQTIKIFGPVFKRMCDHCHNEEFWILKRRITWFTLFFIPIIPYKIEWMLLCPVCTYGLMLESAQVEKLRPLAEINQELETGKITVEQYHHKIALLNSTAVSSSDSEKPSLPEQKALEASKSIFCSECGKEVAADGKFCVHCGTQINQLTT